MEVFWTSEVEEAFDGNVVRHPVSARRLPAKCDRRLPVLPSIEHFGTQSLQKKTHAVDEQHMFLPCIQQPTAVGAVCEEALSANPGPDYAPAQGGTCLSKNLLFECFDYCGVTLDAQFLPFQSREVPNLVDCKVNKLQTKTMNALIVIDVHAKDSVSHLLRVKSIKDGRSRLL